MHETTKTELSNLLVDAWASLEKHLNILVEASGGEDGRDFTAMEQKAFNVLIEVRKRLYTVSVTLGN